MKYSENKTKKSTFFTVILAFLAAVAILGTFSMLFSNRNSGVSGGDEKEDNLIIPIDTNIDLVQKSHGGAYVETVTTELIDKKPVVMVTSDVNGDYIEFSDASFKDFFDSSHTHLNIGFDIVGVNTFYMPTLNIFPLYTDKDGNQKSFEFLTPGNLKIASTTKEQFSCVAFAETENSSVLGVYNTIEKHHIEYEFMKNTSSNTLTLRVVFDDVSETFVYTVTDWEFALNSIRMNLYSSTDEASAVRVENLSVVYIPSLGPYEGEAIVIPSDANEIELSNKVNPLHGVGNAGSSAVLNDDKNTIIVPVSADEDCYGSMYLLDKSEYICANDYDYLTFEFDVTIPEGYEPLGFRVSLLGRASNGSPYEYPPFNSYFEVIGSKLYVLNTNKSYVTAPTESIHVRYVISSGNNDSEPRLQVFFNDMLYYDCSGDASAMFNGTYPNISEIRVKYFSGSGAISFTNLKVCGYTIDTEA